MTTRRRLGLGPTEHRLSTPTDTNASGPAHPRVHATDADLDAGTLYRPDLDSLTDMRTRGVLGWRPPAPDTAPRTYGHGAGAESEN
ncbi:hypothetical protein [Streptomyces sp. NPDC088135]|uniref:hypothetical protein n=1 Tax=Streptomyces sp. NPDC088135 TaxID=3160993 RepID=UPI00342DA167